MSAPRSPARRTPLRRGALLTALAALLLFFLFSAARAAEQAAPEGSVWARIEASGVIRLGFPGDYAPFALAPASGQGWEGLDVALLSRFAARHHLHAVFIQTSWAGLAADLRAGRFEIAGGGVSITPEREKIGLFSRPYLTDGKTVIAPCATARHFATLTVIDRPELRVLVNPGGTNEAFDRRFLPHAMLVLWPDNRSIFQTLAAGKGDLMITDAIEARYQAHRVAGLCAPFASHPFTRSEKAFFLAPDPPLKEALDRFLDEEERSGELARLISRSLD